MTKVALVTGASYGFGKVIAEALLKQGYQVYGTSRTETPDPQIKMRVMELTDDNSVQQCIEGIIQEAGRIDLLVNNAGRFQMSLLEETPLQEVELLLQTNFLGAVRVTNAVLPIMRRRQGGKIIFIGSLAGLVGVAGGYTSAVKHALEGYAEALRLEVEGFGINVWIMQPSYFKTDIYSRRIESDHRPRYADYNGIRDKIENALQKDSENGDDPIKVAQKVIEIAQSDAPGLRYPVGKESALIARMKRYMPERFFLRGMRSRLNS